MQDGDQNEPGWVFKPGDADSQDLSEPKPEAQLLTESSVGAQPSLDPPEDGPHVEWTASEYVAHQKSIGWYALLALGSFGIAAVVYFVTNGDMVSTVIIILLGLSLGIFAARQPRELQYSINQAGINIGEKFYPYQSFKTFSVVRDQGIGYISLAPLRRFMPPLMIHYAPEDEDKIAETLSQYLPYDDHKPDITDIIARKIRF